MEDGNLKMSLSDPIDVHLEMAKQGVESSLEGALASATVAGVLSFMPGIGPAIQSLLDGKARQNVERRWLELFIEIRTHIKEIQGKIPNNSFYGSEEFQTLLALAQEQLWTTHDKEKLRMLATGLANSGSEDFQNDDKESMLRALRATSPYDLKILSHES